MTFHRRNFLLASSSIFVAILPPIASAKSSRYADQPPPPPKSSFVLPDTAKSSSIDGATPLETVRSAQKLLTSLLQNWDQVTVDCTYANVPKSLLETKNKAILLEKASTSALFDKNGSVEVTCRRTNRIVRDCLGVTGKGPLVGLEKKMLGREGKGGLAERLIEGDDTLEEFYDEVDQFSRAISRASSLSYTAGVADLDSLNNFSEEGSGADDEAEVTKKEIEGLPVSAKKDSNLELAREAIVDAKRSIDQILVLVGE